MAVFYSFHYQRDAWRVQQVMQMGVVEGQPLLNSQQWEEVRRKGDRAIENWIDGQMKHKRAVVVLVGAETADRPWVDYEIEKAWKARHPLVGIRIHGLADRNGSTDNPGANPFAQFRLQNGTPLARFVPLYNPTGRTSQAVYADIKSNLEAWVKKGYRRP